MYYANGLKVPYKVPLERIFYHQRGRFNCFIACFISVLYVAGYRSEAQEIRDVYEENSSYYEVPGSLKNRVLNLVNDVMRSKHRRFMHTNGAGWHYLKGNDMHPLVVSLQETDGAVEHCVSVWQGCIYNPNRAFVLECSEDAWNAVCIKFKFRQCKDVYQLMLDENAGKRKRKSNKKLKERRKGGKKNRLNVGKMFIS